MGHYFRFKPRSVFFNIIWMGIIPVGLFYVAYGNEGKVSITDRFRKEPILAKDYVPRSKTRINKSMDRFLSVGDERLLENIVDSRGKLFNIIHSCTL